MLDMTQKPPPPPADDELAQRLKVTWRKANNYFATFATEYYAAKQGWSRGDMTFDEWSARIGLPEKAVARYLIIFERTLSADHAARASAAVESDRRARREERDAARDAARAAREARERQRAERVTKREEAKVAVRAAEEEKRRIAHRARLDPDRNAKRRRKIVEDSGNETLKELLRTGRLPLSTCARIAKMPTETQGRIIELQLANPHLRSYPKRRRPNL